MQWGLSPLFRVAEGKGAHQSPPACFEPKVRTAKWLHDVNPINGAEKDMNPSRHWKGPSVAQQSSFHGPVSPLLRLWASQAARDLYAPTGGPNPSKHFSF